MNIFTNGSRIVQASRDGTVASYVLPTDQPGLKESWWGYLKKGDVLAVGPESARIEVLDERFRVLSTDLSTHRLTIARSGVHYLRVLIDGENGASVRVCA